MAEKHGFLVPDSFNWAFKFLGGLPWSPHARVAVNAPAMQTSKMRLKFLLSTDGLTPVLPTRNPLLPCRHQRLSLKR
jgi:hypothetical protein